MIEIQEPPMRLPDPDLPGWTWGVAIAFGIVIAAAAWMVIIVAVHYLAVTR